MNVKSGSAVKSADRVLDLFEILGEWGPGLSHGELADRLAIPKSSLTQLLRNLLDRGYVRQDADTKSYALGARLETLARRKEQLKDLPVLAQPLLERLTEVTQESAFLNLLSGDSAQLAARVIGPQTLVTVFPIGHLAPLFATAGSRAILAFLPDTMREEYLSRLAEGPLTPMLASVDALRDAVERIRKERIATSKDELVPGIAGLAVPVLSSAGHALGSIAVSLPTVRYTSAKRAVIERALRASVEMLLHHLQPGSDAGAPPLPA